MDIKRLWRRRNRKWIEQMNLYWDEAMDGLWNAHSLQ